MRKILAVSLISISTLISCKDEKKTVSSAVKQETSEQIVPEKTPEFKNKAHELVYNMTQKVGDYGELMRKKDVVYTYTYQTPDGKTDITTEKYMFNGELSYGMYTKHERSLADMEGTLEQGYDGTEYWLKHESKVVNDSAALKRVAFNRPTNFYWFTMMQKLMDPGLNYDYIKAQTVGDANYDVVKVTFDSEDGKPKDIYQLYINTDTKLVDQFLFTVMDFGKSDPLLMELEYEEIDGLLIPTKRRYKASNWDAEVTDKPWINVTWTDIKFNNGLEKADFVK
ncbi:DUF6503 family protein [Formosa algae]|uniref:Uncharacterized protein n=1 Tax=Formosa algae TaxID=225843 RepID=A0A9X0YPJ9_9FLAO|nr:DUF6503 family protein [Formosa algae]MBP1841017.1 hypothetical protein [Formosa algae]MDQ0336563.1 hypothetical protein [Formosa algae]OEI81521.1 hypothetical protein AST99_04585 [Formosa algae]